MKNAISKAVQSSDGLVSRRKSDSTVTVLAVEQALVELGLDAPLTEIVARAQLVEKIIARSRSRCKRERLC
jgi:sRNA-binding carbon storage regulator CsrA